MKRTPASVITLIALILLGTAWAQQGQVLRVRLLGEISNLDPAFLTTVHDQFIANNIYDHLVGFDPETSEIVGELAESWEVSEDGLTYTFTLHEGVHWHKGYGEFTSADVRFSLERILDPATQSPNRTYLEAIQSIDTPDAYTVVINLSEPSAAFLANLAYRAGWIVNEGAITELGTGYGTDPIGTGPFVFSSWQPGAELVLTANEEYFLGRPQLDEVVFVPIIDETVAALALEAGDLDLAYIRDGETASQLEQNPDLVVRSAPATRTLSLMLNSQRAPFDDISVRRAVAHALDREQLVQAVGGLGFPAHAVIAPMFFGYTEDIATYPFDPEKARQLLTDAGYTEPVEVTLFYTQLSPWPQLVPVIKAQMEAVGFQVALDGLEHGTWTSERRNGDYDFTVHPLTRPPDPDFVFSYAYHSEQFPPGFNLSYYDKSDELIEQQARELDPDVRRELVQQILQQISDEVTAVPLMYGDATVAHYEYVRNHPIATNNDFDAYPIYLERD